MESAVKEAPNALKWAWQAAGFLAPLLRRLFRHGRVFAFHMRLACYLLVLSIGLGFWLGYWVWQSLFPAYQKGWPLIAIILPGLLLLAYVRMAREKPKMAGQTHIKDALAWEGSPDSIPLGQIFWNQISALSQRDQAERVLQLWDSGVRVVLMEGYSASGKSAIAAMVGRNIVDRGSRLLPASVYYLNLTTGRGFHAGEGSIGTRVEKALEAFDGSPGNLVYLIIEDIHHDLDGFDKFNKLLNKRDLHLLLTSRPIKDYTLAGRGLETAEGSRPYTPLVWVREEHRLQLSTDRKVVEAIIKSRKAECGNLEAALKFVGMDEPNLLLLAFAIESAKNQNKQVDQVSEDDVKDGLRAHWRETARRLDLHEKDLYSVLDPLSTISEFEVPVTCPYILAASGLGSNEVEKIVKALVKEREIIKLAPEQPKDEPYYLLPHARLASILRQLWIEENRRQELLLTYIRTEPFIGSLVCRLLAEDSNYVSGLLESRRGEIVETPLAAIKLSELGKFLMCLGFVYKDLAHEVAARHREQIGEALVEASLEEIGAFLKSLYLASTDLAQEVAEWYRREILGRSLAGISLREISDFLRHLAYSLTNLPWAVAEQNREELLGRSLSGISLEEIEYFLSSLAAASKDLAREVAKQHREEIEQNLEGVSLAEIGDLLSGIAEASTTLGRELAEQHHEKIGQCLARASLEKIGAFFIALAGASKNLAQEVAEGHHKEILARCPAGASPEEIVSFLGCLGSTSPALTREVAERHRSTIVEMYDNASVDLQQLLKLSMPAFLQDFLGLQEE